MFARCVVCLLAAPLVAQTVTQSAPGAAAQSSTTPFAVPQEVRRVDPPPPTATAADLEQRADALREQKFYTDAMDYYEAAIRKGGSPTIIYNKHGIAALGLMRYDLAKKD